MEVKRIHDGWESVIQGLADALHLLRDDCGIIIPKWLPYNTLLIPMAAVLAYANCATGPTMAATRHKLKQWFWCSVFGQAYERSPNSQAAKDFIELNRWFGDDHPPQTVREFSFNPNSLQQTTPRQRAVYRGVMALLLRHDARDFHSGKKMTANMMLEAKIDDHHVFPQQYLAETQETLFTTQRDCVLNRTLIDKTTNIRINKRAPSDYLAEIDKALGENELEMILYSHLLPSTSGSPLIKDDFEEFFHQRQHLIVQEIENVTRCDNTAIVINQEHQRT